MRDARRMNGQEHTKGNSVTVTPSPFRFHQPVPHGTNSFLLVLNNHSRLRSLLVSNPRPRLPLLRRPGRSAVTTRSGRQDGSKGDGSTCLKHPSLLLHTRRMPRTLLTGSSRYRSPPAAVLTVTLTKYGKKRLDHCNR